MGRPASGSIWERTTAAGVTYSARFKAYGRRRTVRLGSTQEGWDRRRAEEELAFILGQVRRGHWRNEDMPAEEVPEQAITFHEFASDWYDERRAEWAPATQAAYLAELRDHLLPFFADFRLGEIDVAAVDQYRAFKLSEARIGPAYINTTIAKLGTILDLALERELIERNPVRVNPRARRVRRVRKARPIYLDRAEQITALI